MPPKDGTICPRDVEIFLMHIQIFLAAMLRKRFHERTSCNKFNFTKSNRDFSGSSPTNITYQQHRSPEYKESEFMGKLEPIERLMHKKHLQTWLCLLLPSSAWGVSGSHTVSHCSVPQLVPARIRFCRCSKLATRCMDCVRPILLLPGEC